MSRDRGDQQAGRGGGGQHPGRGGGAGRGGGGGRGQGGPGPELKVNPIACEGHGMCIELLPELIAPDPWGYPLIAPGPVPDELLGLARRAVNSCPTLALLLTRSPDPAIDSPPAAQR